MQYTSGLKQLNENLNVCIVEKSSEVGAHIISGNVFETKALDELLPDWKEMEGCPVKTKVSKEKLLFLSEKSSFSWDPACSTFYVMSTIIAMAQKIIHITTTLDSKHGER